MDTDVEDATEHHHQHQAPVEFATAIQELKQEVATVVKEMRVLISKQPERPIFIPFEMTPMPPMPPLPKPKPS